MGTHATGYSPDALQEHRRKFIVPAESVKKQAREIPGTVGGQHQSSRVKYSGIGCEGHPKQLHEILRTFQFLRLPKVNSKPSK